MANNVHALTIKNSAKMDAVVDSSEMEELHGQHQPGTGSTLTPPGSPVALERPSSSTSPMCVVESDQPVSDSSLNRITENSSFSDQLAHLTLQQGENESQSSLESQSHPVSNPASQSNFSLANLTVVTTVGAGTFGRVELVKDNRKQEKWYALKKMRINAVINLRQVSHVLSEKEILSNIDCPFIVKLYWTWRDNISLYLLMEYIPGGELFTHLRNNGRFDEPTSRFYAAEIVHAFIYLHNENIVYRDLKPENVLITTSGHVKLTDFGFAKRIRDRTWTLCGTPEYLSPEVILNSGHGKAVDWWSLGILIHEMLVGEVPFCGSQVFEVYENIVRGYIAPLPFYISNNATSIVRALLKRDRTRRLGNMRNGPVDVQNHPWFGNLNWEDVAQCRLNPPITPYVMYSGDPSNFEEYDREPPITPEEILEEQFVWEQFGDFCFTSPQLLAE